VFGPTGFDLGQLHGNLVIAQARAAALGDGERADRLGALPAELWRAFEAEYRALWPTRVEDRVFGDEVLDSVLDRIRSHTAVFAAAECIRRVVGFAKAIDLETLDDEVRVRAARAVLRAARVLAVDRLDDAAPEALAPRVADAIRGALET
jgi:5-methylthioribose kinase